MPSRTRRHRLLATLAGAMLAAPASAGALELGWSSIDGGGGASAGGDLVLVGLIGQPEASGTPSAGGSLVLTGGFLVGAGGGPRTCSGDVNGNGVVDFTDLLEVLSAWGPCIGCPADLDGSGVVDFADLLQVLSAWGPCPG